MARTIEEIFDTIENLKNTISYGTEGTSGNIVLEDLTSTSNVALWRNQAYITATAHSYVEQNFDLLKSEVDYIRNQSYICTPPWWKWWLTTQYQYSTDPDYGVVYIANNLIPFYKNVDKSLNIVKFCSVKTDQNTRLVGLKLAKLNTSTNEPEQLSQDELTSVLGAVNKVKIAGTRIKPLSAQPDNMKLNLQIFFQGDFVESTVKQNVIDSVKTYLRTIEFDGSLLVNKLLDSIRNVNGVIDAYLVNIYAAPFNQGYIEFDRIYNSLAGYLIFDTSSSNITMTAQ